MNSLKIPKMQQVFALLSTGSHSTLIDVALYYRNGNRIGQIYHAILRTVCSSLNHHLYSKNIDSPLCICCILKIPIITCLIATGSMNFARKWCKKYLLYVNQHWINIYMATESFLMRIMRTFLSEYMNIL